MLSPICDRECEHLRRLVRVLRKQLDEANHKIAKLETRNGELTRSLTACRGSLAECRADNEHLRWALGECREDLAWCNADLESCEVDNKWLTTALLECIENEDVLRRRLAACHEDARACHERLWMCESSHATCEARLARVTNALNYCSGALNACFDDLYECTDNLGDCRDGFGKCREELAECRQGGDRCEHALRECREDLLECRESLCPSEPVLCERLFPPCPAGTVKVGTGPCSVACVDPVTCEEKCHFPNATDIGTDPTRPDACCPDPVIMICDCIPGYEAVYHRHYDENGCLVAITCECVPGRCSDGTDLLCLRPGIPQCPPGQILAIQDHCWVCVDPETCEPCRDGTVWDPTLNACCRDPATIPIPLCAPCIGGHGGIRPVYDDSGCLIGYECFCECPNGRPPRDFNCTCVNDDQCRGDTHCVHPDICGYDPAGNAIPCPVPCLTDTSSGIAQCLGICVPGCDDGTPELCDRPIPNCPPGQIVAVQNGCYVCVDPDTCRPCDEGTTWDPNLAACCPDTIFIPRCLPCVGGSAGVRPVYDENGCLLGYECTCECPNGLPARDGHCTCFGDNQCRDGAHCTHPEVCGIDPAGNVIPCHALCDINADGTVANCLGICVEGCDDGSPLVCDQVEPECPHGQIAAVQRGCWVCVDPDTCEPCAPETSWNPDLAACCPDSIFIPLCVECVGGETVTEPVYDQNGCLIGYTCACRCPNNLPPTDFHCTCQSDRECLGNSHCVFPDFCDQLGSPLPCRGVCVPGCDDGTELVCDQPPPECPRGQIAAVQDGCWVCVDPDTCRPCGDDSSWDSELNACCPDVIFTPLCAQCVGGATVLVPVYNEDGCLIGYTCDCQCPNGLEPRDNHCTCFGDDQCRGGTHCQHPYCGVDPVTNQLLPCPSLCAVEADGTYRCLGICVEGCDDGRPLVCDSLPPECPRGQIAAVRNGCWVCVDPDTCRPCGDESSWNSDLNACCPDAIFTPLCLQCVGGNTVLVPVYNEDGCLIGYTCDCQCPNGLEPRDNHCTCRGDDQCAGDAHCVNPYCGVDSTTGVSIPCPDLCAIDADGTRNCLGICVEGCDDGTPALCLIPIPAECPPGQILAVRNYCYVCVDPDTCEPCDVGSSWDPNLAACCPDDVPMPACAPCIGGEGGIRPIYDHNGCIVGWTCVCECANGLPPRDFHCTCAGDAQCWGGTHCTHPDYCGIDPAGALIPCAELCIPGTATSAQCLGICVEGCDDGTPLLCDAVEHPSCPRGQVPAVRDHCWVCVDPATCEPCPDGTSWNPETGTCCPDVIFTPDCGPCVGGETSLRPVYDEHGCLIGYECVCKCSNDLPARDGHCTCFGDGQCGPGTHCAHPDVCGLDPAGNLLPCPTLCDVDASGVTHCLGICVEGCGDGTPLLCNQTQPYCPHDTVAVVQGGCWVCVDPTTCAPPPCWDGGGLTCRIVEPTCPVGTILALQGGCWDCVVPRTCEPPPDCDGLPACPYPACPDDYWTAELPTPCTLAAVQHCGNEIGDEIICSDDGTWLRVIHAPLEPPCGRVCILPASPSDGGGVGGTP